ncbi:MAG: BON domain-containing protein [Bacteriovoracaceae bacterium]
MEKKARKNLHYPLLYIPWALSQDDFNDEEENSWITYVRRNLPHLNHDIPFPDSSWSYTRKDSPFEEEDKFKKSDTALREEVLDLLYKSPVIDASDIRVIVLSGVVDLYGSVLDLYQKNEAERLILSIPQVWGVHNELKIANEHSSGKGGTNAFY